jgi:flagellar biosynthesis/type III secretory pathway protein FliH
LGRDEGRKDLGLLAAPLSQAIDAACEQINMCHAHLSKRVAELAELFTETVLRHRPSEFTRGYLARLEETLSRIDAGSVVVYVAPSLLAQASDALTARSSTMVVQVEADDRLSEGEFRVQADWADAEGTFVRFFDAARDALALYMAEEAP